MTKQIVLADAKFANQTGYSDITPYEIVRVISEKTIEIRRMKAELNPEWKPEIIPGGFAGTCVNQNSQKWIITSDETARVERARLRKDGDFHSAMGRHVLGEKPVRYYDYNF